MKATRKAWAPLTSRQKEGPVVADAARVDVPEVADEHAAEAGHPAYRAVQRGPSTSTPSGADGRRGPWGTSERKVPLRARSPGSFGVSECVEHELAPGDGGVNRQVGVAGVEPDAGPSGAVACAVATVAELGDAYRDPGN